MDLKNVIVSAFTRFRASNLGRAVTTKIYHRIRNVKNAEKSEEKKKRRERKKKENTEVRGRGERWTRDSCTSSKAAGRWSLIQVECVFEDFVAGSYANTQVSPGAILRRGEKGGPANTAGMINCRVESPGTNGGGRGLVPLLSWMLGCDVDVAAGRLKAFHGEALLQPRARLQCA